MGFRVLMISLVSAGALALTGACDRQPKPVPIKSATAAQQSATLPSTIVPSGGSRKLTSAGETADVRHIAIGEIALPSGKIVVQDGMMGMEDKPPFAQSVPPGKYTVYLTLAKRKDDDRVAFATIRFADREPIKWEPATWPAQAGASTRESDEVLGYAVDSGTGCFADPAAIRTLAKKLSGDRNFAGKLIDVMDQQPGSMWANVILDDAAPNYVVFSTGFGDGGYASYWGRDADGKIVCLVSDFDVLDRSEDPWKEWEKD